MKQITVHDESLKSLLRELVIMYNEIYSSIYPENYHEYLECRKQENYDIRDNEMYRDFKTIYDEHRNAGCKEIFDVLNINSPHDLIEMYFEEEVRLMGHIQELFSYTRPHHYGRFEMERIVSDEAELETELGEYFDQSLLITERIDVTRIYNASTNIITVFDITSNTHNKYKSSVFCFVFDKHLANIESAVAVETRKHMTKNEVIEFFSTIRELTD